MALRNRKLEETYPVVSTQVDQVTQGFFLRKNILITGGSSGIGRALAEELTLRGANVMILARREFELARTFRTLKSRQVNSEQKFYKICADISNQKSLDKNLPEMQGFDPDVIINCAGMACAKEFSKITPEEVQTILATNLTGAMYLTHLLLPGMRKKKAGHLGFVGSLAGEIGLYGYTAYAASKFGIRGFAESLREEVKPEGISVSLLCPPDVDTPMLELENQTKPPELLAMSGSNCLTPQEVALDYLRGIENGSFQIFPGVQTNFIAFFMRHCPKLIYKINQLTIRKVRKNQAGLITKRKAFPLPSFTLPRIQLFAALGFIAFWIYFFQAEINNPANSEAYLSHELSFWLADLLWITPLLLLSSFFLKRHKAIGTIFSISSGGALVFLGLLDFSYCLREGIFSRSLEDLILFGMIVSGCTALGLVNIFSGYLAFSKVNQNLPK